jgi:hypothetical protein
MTLAEVGVKAMKSSLKKKLSFKMSKAIKLSKNYSLKTSKNDEIISFTFPIFCPKTFVEFIKNLSLKSLDP